MLTNMVLPEYNIALTCTSNFAVEKGVAAVSLARLTSETAAKPFN